MADLTRPNTFSVAVARKIAHLVAAVQLIGLISVGVYLAAHFRVWSPIDEAAHFSFIQKLATEHRLPIFGADYLGNEIIALADHIYPTRSSKDPRTMGLFGLSYEAFQPPLYYVSALPAYLAAGPNFVVKVNSVRLFGLFLLLSSLYFVYRILALTLAEDWPFALPIAMLPYAIPALLVRNITVSNCALEASLIGAYLLTAIFHPRAKTFRCQLLASVFLGLLFLTKLTTGYLITLHAVVVFFFWHGGSRNPRSAARAALLLAMPGLLMLPWLWRNSLVHGSLTANGQVMELMLPILNPTRAAMGFAEIWQALRLMMIPLPEEWGNLMWPHIGSSPAWLGWMFIYLPALAGFAFAVSHRQWRLLVLGLLPVAATLFLMVASISSRFPVVLNRYMFSTMPYWGAFMGIVAVRLLRRRGALLYGLALSSVLVGLWATALELM